MGYLLLSLSMEINDIGKLVSVNTSLPCLFLPPSPKQLRHAQWRRLKSNESLFILFLFSFPFILFFLSHLVFFSSSFFIEKGTANEGNRCSKYSRNKNKKHRSKNVEQRGVMRQPTN